MISIIIVSYNVKDYLKQCLNSLMQSPDIKRYEVIVVDNNSFDNSSKIIENKFPFVQLVSLNKNVGYAKAVNLAVKKATGTHICLLNPDTIVKQNTIGVLSTFLSNEDADIVGCKVLNADGSFQLASRRKFPSFWVSFCKLIGLYKIFPKSRYIGAYNYTYQSEDEVQIVDAVNGACIMFKRQLFNDLGGFDERFFLYFEDTDFCYRAKSKDFKIKYIPSTSIIHYKGESHHHAPFDVDRIFMQSMRKFYSKHKKEFLFWRIIDLLLPIVTIFRNWKRFLTQRKDSLLSFTFDLLIITLIFSVSLLGWLYAVYDKSSSIELIFNHLYLLVNIVISWLIATRVTKLYLKNHLSYARSVVSTLIMFLISATSTYLLSFFAYSRGVLVISSIGIFFSTAIWRILFHYVSKFNLFSIFKNILFTRKAIIIGANSEAIRIGQALMKTPDNGFQLIGYVADKWIRTDKIEGLGRLSELNGIIDHHQINEIIIPEKILTFEKIIKLLESISVNNINLKIVPNGKNMLIGKGLIENISGIPLLDMEIPILDSFHIKAKRYFDFILSGLFLLVSFPLLALFILVKGTNKVEIWSIDNSVTHITQVKSKYKIIQKLPYLFSILKGDLSFVGSKIIETSHQYPKILIKPGITGLVQIKEAESYIEEYEVFDQYYMQNQSFMFDIEILFKSILRI